MSYSHADRKIATGLRRNLEARGIGVWYAPTTLEVGNEWRRCIEEGIDQATIFIAVITDNYLASPICIGELTRFHRRIEAGPEPRPHILPVLGGLSEDGKTHHVVRPIFDRYHYIDISVRFIDGLTALLARVQRLLNRR